MSLMLTFFVFFLDTLLSFMLVFTHEALADQNRDAETGDNSIGNGTRAGGS